MFAALCTLYRYRHKIHSIGHHDRLNRRELIESKGMRTQDYAVEELTAEMGASYLKSYAGIPIEELENNAAYIEAWLERLKKDKRFIVRASAQAQKAVDYILNLRNEEKEIESLEKVEGSEKEPLRMTEMKQISTKPIITVDRSM
jgi:antirestriction protein ArdC